MSNPSLPPKPDFQVDYSPPRSSVMAHPGPRRSPPPRERERYPRSPPPRYARGPPPRSSDVYGTGSRDRDEERFRESYRGRDYDRRDRERDREYATGPPEPRYRRDDSWEPGERRDIEARRRYDDDDRRGYRRDPPRTVGDTRPWPRAGTRFGRDFDRSRYDRGPEAERRRRASRSPPSRRFERSPSSRARSPLTVRRRSGSPPPRRLPRTPSPATRISTRAPAESSVKAEPRPHDDEAERDLSESSLSRKRSRERRSRSRSASVSDRKRVARSATPAPPEKDKSSKLEDAPSQSEDVPSKAEDVSTIVEEVQNPDFSVHAESPPRNPRSPTPTPVKSENQEPRPVPRIETDMDVDQLPMVSPAETVSAKTDNLSPVSVSLPLKPLPTGPRNYVKTPTGMQSPQQPSPVATSRSPTILDPNAPLPSVSHARPHKLPTGPSERPKTFFPPIDWNIPRTREGKIDPVKDPEAVKKAKLTERELELARLRTARTHFIKEYSANDRSEARISHELALSTLELQLAQNRRIIADAQLDKARAGVLGIDYVRPDPEPKVEI